jgi:muconolactone delta-isomerase
MGDVRATTNFLAEWYLPDLADAAVDDIMARLRTAATELTSGGARVRLVATLSVPTDEVLYGVFDADSPDAVVATCEHAGLPHQRLSADVVTRVISEASQVSLLSGAGAPEGEAAEQLVAH